MKRLISLLSISLLLWNCSETGDENGSNDNFDRAALLTNIADNIIIPRYEDYNQKLNVLVEKKNDFIASQSSTNLTALRAWKTAYLSWQAVEVFNIGKAEEIQYHYQVNIFPVSTNDIEKNINNGSYGLGSVNNNDAVGFPAMERYLLNGVGENDNTVLSFYSGISSQRKYLSI